MSRAGRIALVVVVALAVVGAIVGLAVALASRSSSSSGSGYTLAPIEPTPIVVEGLGPIARSGDA